MPLVNSVFDLCFSAPSAGGVAGRGRSADWRTSLRRSSTSESTTSRRPTRRRASAASSSAAPPSSRRRRSPRRTRAAARTASAATPAAATSALPRPPPSPRACSAPTARASSSADKHFSAAPPQPDTRKVQNPAFRTTNYRELLIQPFSSKLPNARPSCVLSDRTPESAAMRRAASPALPVLSSSGQVSVEAVRSPSLVAAVGTPKEGAELPRICVVR